MCKACVLVSTRIFSNITITIIHDRCHYQHCCNYYYNYSRDVEKIDEQIEVMQILFSRFNENMLFSYTTSFYFFQFVSLLICISYHISCLNISFSLIDMNTMI